MEPRKVPETQYDIIALNNADIASINDLVSASEESKEWPSIDTPEMITVNVGDTISISIFESQSGGLFIPEDSSVRPGNFVTLPAQTIDQSGMVMVPYVGKIKAAGKTTQEIATYIEDELELKAIEPQVVVSFASRDGAEVSVLGDVNDPSRLSLGFNQYKILDVIASAGGPSSPGYETWVTLQRNGEEYTIPFDHLVQNPSKNVYAQINDTLYLYQEPKIFLAYGAVNDQGRIPFGKRELYLSEALGLSQGLNDSQADPAEVYIYREMETGQTLDTIEVSGVETIILPTASYDDKLEGAAKPAGSPWGKIPVSDADLIQIKDAPMVQSQPVMKVKANTKSKAVVIPKESLGWQTAPKSVSNIQLKPNMVSRGEAPVRALSIKPVVKKAADVKSVVSEAKEPVMMQNTDTFKSILSDNDAPVTAAPAPWNTTRPTARTRPITQDIIVTPKPAAKKVITPVVKKPEVKVSQPVIIQPAVKLKEPVLIKSQPKQTIIVEEKPVAVKVSPLPVKKAPAPVIVQTPTPEAKPMVMKAAPVQVIKQEPVVRTVTSQKPVKQAVIYKLDLSSPTGFFLAQKFKMKNNDIIYVANAKSVELQKFLSIINSTSTTTNNTKNAF